MSETKGKEYLTVKDVMRLAHVTQMTVYRWINEGKIDAKKAVKGSKKWLIDPMSLPTFMREGNYEKVVNDE